MCELCQKGLIPADAHQFAWTGTTTTTTTSGKPSLGYDQAAGRIAEVAWTGAASHAITYAFRSSSPDAGFERFDARLIAATEQALQLWADVADITFQRVGAGSYSNSATMLFSGDTNSGGYGWAYLPGSESVSSLAGDVFLNTSGSNFSSMALGSYEFMALVHEIGHAIGLNHPGAYNGGYPTYSASAEYREDSRQYTLMSYFAAENTGAVHGMNYAATPLLHDIAAAQALYGANWSTRAGDTVYGWNATAGRASFSIGSASQKVVFAIWDGGGDDTLDMSGYWQASRIDLNEMAFSSVGGLGRNIAIARGAVIENAIGGTGADTIVGNGADNQLTGGLGNDSMDGRAGDDALDGGDGADTLNGGAGMDALTGGLGNDRLHGGADADTAFGGEGNDTFDGGAGNDELYGENGDDVIGGGDGDDALYGGEGRDTLRGGNGNDALHGGNGNDSLDGGAGDDALYGEDGDDLVSGGAGNDRIEGGEGRDTLRGLAGNDLFVGEAGDDLIDGGAGTDTIDYSAASGPIIANLTTRIIQGADTGTDTVTNVEGVIGSGGDDQLYGNTLANVLGGGQGSDLLRGGAGGDTMTGGEGADTYHWLRTDIAALNTATSFDRITDFDMAEDVLDLHDVVGALPRTVLDDVVRLVDRADGTMVQAKVGTAFKDVVLLEGVHGASGEAMLSEGHLLA